MRCGHLYDVVTGEMPDELEQQLAVGGAFELRRIVSRGHATPPGQWYEQDVCEWVALLSGSARLRFADPDETHHLLPGDWLDIPPGRRHRVEATDAQNQTVWLAVYFTPSPD
jgi:cupin 2 domain-containing protein